MASIINGSLIPMWSKGPQAAVTNSNKETWRPDGLMLKAWGLKSMLSYRGLEVNINKCLYEGVTGPTALYGAEAWGLRSAERTKVNVLEMQCLRSLVGGRVTNGYRVKNEKVYRNYGIEKELASRVHTRLFKWFGHMDRMDQYLMSRRVLMAEVNGVQVRGWPRLGCVRVRLERNDGGGCETMR